MKIVVVDDDKAFLESMKLILSHRGFSVNTYHHPQKAVSSIKENPDVDILMVDYMMPSLRGDQLIRLIEDDLPPFCRKIIISGHTDMIENDFLKKDGIAFLPKPLDLSMLSNVLPENGSWLLGKHAREG